MTFEVLYISGPINHTVFVHALQYYACDHYQQYKPFSVHKYLYPINDSGYIIPSTVASHTLIIIVHLDKRLI